MRLVRAQPGNSDFVAGDVYVGQVSEAALNPFPNDCQLTPMWCGPHAISIYHYHASRNGQFPNGLSALGGNNVLTENGHHRASTSEQTIMSRNEIFLLLACAFVAAIMFGSPGYNTHQPPVTLASLMAPVSDVVSWDMTDIAEHGFDRQ